MNDVSIIIQIQIFWMIRNMTKGLSINALPYRSGFRVCCEFAIDNQDTI